MCDEEHLTWREDSLPRVLWSGKQLCVIWGTRSRKLYQLACPKASEKTICWCSYASNCPIFRERHSFQGCASDKGPRDGEKQPLSWLRVQLTSASIRIPWNNRNPTANINTNNKKITILTLLKHPLCAKYFKHLIILTLGQSRVCVCVCVYSIIQLCLTLCHPMDCSPPDSSVHGIFQERILEWVSISFSRGSTQPRDRTHVSCVSCTGRWILYHCMTWEAIPWSTCYHSSFAGKGTKAQRSCLTSA